VGAHAALEGIFRVKGTDVKDDAANFLHNRSSAVRRQAPAPRIRFSLPEHRDWR